MNRIFNKDFLYLIPVLFMLIAVIRGVVVYNDVKSQEYNFVKKQAEVLNDYMLVHRQYYQDLYISHKIPLTEETLEGLPAFSSSPISYRFSEKNIFDITVRTVSDRARNIKNMADVDEMEAIGYFNAKPKEEQYFMPKEDYYQFAHVLRIEQKCLKCHGHRDAAPEFIRQKYDLAYDYKLGDVRGMISIKIPKEMLHAYFFKQFVYSIVYDVLLLTLLFLLINYLLRRFNNVNHELEAKVVEKTQKISSQKAVLESYVKALDKTAIISKADRSGIISYVNDAFINLSGYSKEELIGQSHSIVRHPDTPKALIEKLWNKIESKQIFTGTLYWLTKDHRKLTLRVSVVPVLNDKEEIVEYIAARTDITELIQKKEELKNALLTDALTALPNRHQLLRKIEKHPRKGNLGLLNIDSFKEINDFYGHDVGDKLLQEVGLMLDMMCADKVSVFKLPSDEFALFASAGVHPKLFEENISGMIEAIEHKVFAIDTYSIYISFSCGIASEQEELLIKADMALKRAKAEKEHLVIYNKNIDSSIEIARNLKGINILKKAIEADRIIALYQPIYNLKNSKVDKYEALVRIEDEYGYLQPPSSFLEIAKRSKLYFNITRAMIEKSFRMFAENDYEFSVNLSMQDVKDRKTVAYIKSRLAEFPQTHRVIFEITESDEIEDYTAMKSFIQTVKAYGVKIAIDDFGSGYANFSHILELDVDYIKLDASLIKNIEERHSRILVEAIVDFSKRLNIKTIAEYVETQESMDILDVIGVDYIQGYLIGKPSTKLVE